MPENGLFVVRAEGGEYEWLSAAEWNRRTGGAPIYGVKVGRLMLGRDRILKGHGHNSVWCRDVGRGAL